jgi:AcrR family transcriptional regulator
LFIILNVGSVHEVSRDSAPVDDRTTRARIRDAAIACIADNGISGTTVRRIATAAGVSAGLVIHHFGSMEGLRAECDDHVAESIRRYKRSAISEGPSLDVLAALRGSEAMPWLGYLVAVLADDSPTVALLVDELVADAEGYLELGVETGMIRPSPNPGGRAAVLLLWSLGALVLHQHVERILGVDLTDPNIAESPTIAAYAGPVYEIMGEGIFTEAFAERLKQVFPPWNGGNGTTDDEDHPAPPTPASKSPSKEAL